MELEIKELSADVYRRERGPREQLKAIVLHSTDGATLGGMLAHFSTMAKQNKARGYHYIINRDGSVYKALDPEYGTTHASGANRASISIAFVGGRKRVGSINQTQIQAADQLIGFLKERYCVEFLLGHKHVYIKPGLRSGKPDPQLTDTQLGQLAKKHNMRFDKTGEEMLRLNESLKQKELSDAFGCLILPGISIPIKDCQRAITVYREMLPDKLRKVFDEGLAEIEDKRKR